MQQRIIYLDNNATTKIDERVLEAMIPYFTESYANASSSHLAGLTANDGIEKAAWQTADLINAEAEEIVFTSGATEAINLAIKGLANEQKKHLVTIATEHKAVLECCEFMEDIGFEITYMPTGNDGLININLLDEITTDKTLAFIGMFTNNETGVLQNINKISTILKRKNVVFLCDATQAAGKTEIDVKKLGIDLLALSAHKFHGPKGIGALYISAEARLKLIPQISGGNQQRKLRSGTLNTTGIIGLGKACEIAVNELEENKKRIQFLRDKLEKGLLQFEGSFVNGSIENRIYTTSNICFPGVNSEELIMALSTISVSNGASCSAVTSKPSHVLKAMGLSDDEALSSIRFSLSKYTTEEEIDFTIEKVLNLCRKLRG
ncbi:cysteine desulfurase family protein [Flavobacterium olei]|uniref:cysteine desulfurase family protein n=1 Tax=Flavobacterium olei TaxID=1886782 RepID=UPI00321B89E0